MPQALPLLLAVGGFFIGALFVGVGWFLWQNGRDLRTQGVTVRAVIRQKVRTPGLGNNALRCAFDAHEVDVAVPSKLWHQLREGRAVPLTHLPGRPETARYGSRLAWRVRGGIGLGMMALGGVVLVVFPVVGVQEWLAQRAPR